MTLNDDESKMVAKLGHIMAQHGPDGPDGSEPTNSHLAHFLGNLRMSGVGSFKDKFASGPPNFDMVVDWAEGDDFPNVALAMLEGLIPR